MPLTDPTRGVLQSFLFGVARNMLLKRDDARVRHVSHTRPDGDDGDDGADLDDLLIDPAPQPPQRLLMQEQAEAVRRALSQLAPHYRDVVILYEMHDLSYLEIAHVCNIDIGTVRSRLSRARAKLLELLQDDSGEATADVRAATAPHQQEARP